MAVPAELRLLPLRRPAGRAVRGGPDGVRPTRLRGPAATDVAVVGGGPVGVLVALLLARRGVDVRVLERAHDVHPLPRAVAADPAVLQALADAGLAATARGLPVLDGVRLDRVAGADVPLLHLHPAGAGVWPGLATYSQPDLEVDLRAALHRVAPDALVGGADVVAVEVGGRAGDGAAVLLRVRRTASTGEEAGPSEDRVLRARAVVAADGAHSAVRAAVGVRARRLRGRHRWTVLDLALPAPLDRRSLTFTLDPRRPCVDLPVPGGHRVEALLAADEPDDALTGDGRDALLRGLLGDDGVPPPAQTCTTADAPRLLRAASYTFTTGVADRFRAGPVLLVGDAAHQVPPFLGQGLALGVGDAVGLAWRLADVLAGRAGTASLDRWSDERRRAALSAAVRSRAAGVALQARRTAGLRDLVLRAAPSAPALGPWLATGGPRPPARVRPASGGGPGDVRRRVRAAGPGAGAQGREATRPRGVGVLLPDVGVRPPPGPSPDHVPSAGTADRATSAAGSGGRVVPRDVVDLPTGAGGGPRRLGEVLGAGWALLHRPEADRLLVRAGAHPADVLADDAGPAAAVPLAAGPADVGVRDLDAVLAVGELALVRPDRALVAALPDAPGARRRLERLAAAQVGAP